MVEPIEQRLLERLAREISFQAGDCAVEFGAFFGKSTSFIAKGLASNKTRVPTLFVYDSFGCASDGNFQSQVIRSAQRGGVLNLVRRHNGRLDFYPVFHFYLREQLESGAVVPVQAELVNSHPPEGSLAFIHIDSPKTYTDFKPILFRFFTKMRVGATVVFQDFFYHWSATLIAAVGGLIHLGFLEVRETAASSLVCVLLKPLDQASALEVDLRISSDDEVIKLIDYAVDCCQTISIDRPDIFVPRLQLAKFQWHMERGEGESAAEVVRLYFKKGNKLNQSVFDDFLELTSNSFSIEKLYRLDHKAI
jgi:hypothetical protein